MQPGVIIVSNRLPLSVKKVDGKLEFYPSVGGLATGLSSYVTNKRNKWIGWPGVASDDLTETEKQTITTELATRNCYPVFLTQKQLDGFYNGYSNSVLWPLFHDMPVKTKIGAQNWKTYRAVNKAFAEEVLALSEAGSTIWVHDYQLLILPAILRAERPKDNIGLFLHIPFPNPESFGELSESKALLSGMLGSDLVGFHTTGYANNFLECCQQLDAAIVEPRRVILGDRVVRVAELPMGIDYAKFSKAAKLQAVKKESRRLKRLYKNLKVILTVDRLEPSKGLVERIEAYEAFLEQNPKVRGKVVMVMLAVPSRTEIAEYKELKIKLEKIVKRINKHYGSPFWKPVDYMFTSLPFETIAALYQRADVAFITPLRDGMNLVAKEYIASKPRQNGVLILSETAGAAEELKEAIIVNPTERSSLIDALTRATTMPPRELKRRIKTMQKQVEHFTVHEWAGSFMKSLSQPLPGTRKRSATLSKSRRNNLIKAYRQTSSRLLLLDYDGVLVPFNNNPEKAGPSRQLLKLLTKLASADGNDVAVISGRPKESLESWFGDLPLTLAAEHGALIRPAGDRKWHKTSSSSQQWKQTIKPILEKYAARTPGASVEEKVWSLVWHYRRAQPYYAQKNLVILKRLFKSLSKDSGLTAQQGRKILEVRPADINKGNVVRYLLNSTHEFVLAIGDDATDEDMFTALPPGAHSIKVGRGQTAAGLRAASVKDILKLLEKF